MVALLIVGSAGAGARPPEACVRAAAEAERRWSVPPNLLAAIGRVETGRVDEAGRVEPWPWSANAAGTSYVFSSAAEAATVIGYLRARGIASIDVGCFQVNLHHHPGAFATPADGFDPELNADYAARFLRALYERTRSWATAVAEYHSADPALGMPYRDKVLSIWHVDQTRLRTQGDPHVILEAVSAATIPVYTPATLPPELRQVLGLQSRTSSLAPSLK